MLNWILRYSPVISVLDQAGAKSVLDVGAGWHGLSRWWPHHVVQTDLDFGDEPPVMRRAGTADFVPASADALPFEDNQFEFAVSLDMVEHLPNPLRAKSIQELTRVASRGVLIGYPVGHVAKQVDEQLASRLGRRNKELPPWLSEHLAQEEYPERDTVLSALPSGWTITKELPSGNAGLQRELVDLESRRLVGRLSPLAERVVARFPALARLVDWGETYRLVWLIEPARLDSKT